VTAKYRTWILPGALAFASLTLALALVEFGLRLFDPQPTGLSRQDRFGLALHAPGITRYLPQYGTTVTFNSAGMRDREHPLEKPPGVFRVLLLGDSFMEALQVPFEKSFPSLLEQQLEHATGKRVEVVNAGVSGWGTDDELRYLTSYGLAYRPDLVVVVMTLHNDISDNFREDWHTMQDGILVDQPRAPMSYLRYQIVELKSFLASRLQLYQLWRRVRHGGEMRQTAQQLNSHIVQLFRIPTPDRIDWGFQFTGLLLSRMQAELSASGGRVALVLLPLRVQISDSLFASFVRTAGVAPTEMSIGAPQRRMLSIAANLGIPAIDLLPSFRQWTADSAEPLYLEWDGHWNEAGHRLAADAAALGLMEAGVGPVAP
jgi:hypothetical protein